MRFNLSAEESGKTSPRRISVEAMDFISACLNLDPALRITAEQMLRHPWITGRRVSSEADAGSGGGRSDAVTTTIQGAGHNLNEDSTTQTLQVRRHREMFASKTANVLLTTAATADAATVKKDGKFQRNVKMLDKRYPSFSERGLRHADARDDRSRGIIAPLLRKLKNNLTFW